MSPWADLNAQLVPQTTATFRVSAHVESVCKVTAPDTAIGTGTARGGVELQITATCTPNSTYAIGHNEKRRSNAPGADAVTGTGTGSSQVHTIFGSVPATQVVPGDEYTDTITVRVYH